MSKVKLHRPGWTNSSWNPHGLFEPIRFDRNDSATIDEDSFDEWIGDDMARVAGITVTRPKQKPVAKTAVKQPAAKKKTAPKDK